MEGDVTQLALYAGQSAGLVTESKVGAAEILTSLVAEAQRARNLLGA